MRWATRAGLHIDRAACAWLIRRFLDPAAEFVWVDDPAQTPPDATGFDMRGVDLSHHGRGDGTVDCQEGVSADRAMIRAGYLEGRPAGAEFDRMWTIAMVFTDMAVIAAGSPHAEPAAADLTERLGDL